MNLISKNPRMNSRSMCGALGQRDFQRQELN